MLQSLTDSILIYLQCTLLRCVLFSKHKQSAKHAASANKNSGFTTAPSVSMYKGLHISRSTSSKRIELVKQYYTLELFSCFNNGAQKN